MLVTASLLLLSAVESPADTVVLKPTGSEPERQLQGSVLSVTDREVILKTPEGIRLPLSRSSVSWIYLGDGTEGFTRAGEPDTSASNPPVPATAMQPVVPITTPISAPNTPVRPAPSLEKLYHNLDHHSLHFPGENGGIDEKRFITLSRFTGHRSGSLYAGLYNFTDKGTFWIHLPDLLTRPGTLRFTLYGKKNEAQPTERFSAKARFIDATGRVIGESPLAFFSDTDSPPVEWFRHLEGISGLGGAALVEWQVPAQTRSIEIRATSESNPDRHLVGYLGNLSLGPTP